LPLKSNVKRKAKAAPASKLSKGKLNESKASMRSIPNEHSVINESSLNINVKTSEMKRTATATLDDKGNKRRRMTVRRSISFLAGLSIRMSDEATTRASMKTKRPKNLFQANISHIHSKLSQSRNNMSMGDLTSNRSSFKNTAQRITGNREGKLEHTPSKGNVSWQLQKANQTGERIFSCASLAK
jgi:hypothetical protein